MRNLAQYPVTRDEKLRALDRAMERELRDSSFGAIHPAAIAAIRRQIALEDIPLHQTLMQAMNIAVARHNALFTKHASADERRVSEEFFRDIEAILNRRRSV